MAASDGLLFVLPIFAGVIAIAFMIKPLFAPRRNPFPAVSLCREEQPFLYAFVERLCTVVEAPRPERIDVTVDVNASASFDETCLAPFRSGVVLTIGTPLAASMSLRSLTGVLAHEFGHFSQGSGMRLTYVVRSINAWFARVVYERDVWDERLARLSSEIDLRIGIIFYAIRLLIWLSRGILWLFMMIAHGASCFTLRQMEFDADRYEARVAGSEEFEKTVDRLVEIQLASRGAYTDLGAAWHEGRLTDDLTALIHANLDQSSAVDLENAVAESRKRRTALFDTHPCDTARIESARAEEAPGIFTIVADGTALFRDFDSVAKKVTLAHYQQALEEEVHPGQLLQAARVAEAAAATTRFVGLAKRYFHDIVSLEHHLELAADPRAKSDAPESALADLEAARSALEELAPAVADASARNTELQSELANCERAAALQDVGMGKLAGGEFAGGNYKELRAVAKQRSRLQSELAVSREVLTAFRRESRTRLLRSIDLLDAPRVRQSTLDPAIEPARLGVLVGAVTALESQSDEFVRLTEHMQTIRTYCEALEKTGPNERVTNALLNLAGKIHEQLDDLADVPAKVPTTHEDELWPLGIYLVGTTPPGDDVNDWLHLANRVLERFSLCYARTLGELAQASEAIETALGFEPLVFESERSQASTEGSIPDGDSTQRRSGR